MDSSENNYSKAYIYVDTNKLETKISKDSMFLDRIVASKAFYGIIDLIKELSLEEIVNICIPEIVLMELEHHLVSHYKSQRASLEDKFELATKEFGNIIELNYDFKINSIEEYKEKVEYILSDFIHNPRYSINIIPYPREQGTFERIIHNATHTIKPFVRTKGPNKSYSDAGLKDAVILETFIENTKSDLGILLTDDNDFKDAVKKENLFVCKTVEEVQEILISKLGLDIHDSLDKVLTNSEYLITRILNECDFSGNEQHEFVKVIEHSENDLGTFVEFVMEVDNVTYIFDATIDLHAKELVSVSCSEYYGDEFDETE